MRRFAGFPTGKTRFTPIPDLFFSELLAAIDDLAECKLTLYFFWALSRQKGYPRYLTHAELQEEGPLLSALQGEQDLAPAELEAVLDDALDAAVLRGTLLRLTVCADDVTTRYYMLNTPQGRKAAAEVQRGELVLETSGYVRQAPSEAHLDQPQSNIFSLYEQNIGLVPPLLVDRLQAAQDAYPASWLTDAFRVAVENNARAWRYIETVLQRWEREGKDDGTQPNASGRGKRRRNGS